MPSWYFYASEPAAEVIKASMKKVTMSSTIVKRNAFLIKYHSEVLKAFARMPCGFKISGTLSRRKEDSDAGLI